VPIDTKSDLDAATCLVQKKIEERRRVVMEGTEKRPRGVEREKGFETGIWRNGSDTVVNVTLMPGSLSSSSQAGGSASITADEPELKRDVA
jgi:hypothetical protein